MSVWAVVCLRDCSPLPYYYLAWELTIWRLRAILQSDHPEDLSDPRHEDHITTDYLKDDKQD